jgi:hypothetical protein
MTAKHAPLFMQVAQIGADGLDRDVKPACQFLDRHKAGRFDKGDDAVASAVKGHCIRRFSHGFSFVRKLLFRL